MPVFSAAEAAEAEAVQAFSLPVSAAGAAVQAFSLPVFSAAEEEQDGQPPVLPEEVQDGQPPVLPELSVPEEVQPTTHKQLLPTCRRSMFFSFFPFGVENKSLNGLF